MVIKDSSKHRFYAFLLILGSSILLYRVFTLISNGFLTMMAKWVAALLIIELLIDLVCLVLSIMWWRTNNKENEQNSLRFGAAAALLHAVRVLIFVLGRVGPSVDFDVRPEFIFLYQTTWTWSGLYFAAIMATLGVIGVIVIWRTRARLKLRK